MDIATNEGSPRSTARRGETELGSSQSAFLRRPHDASNSNNDCGDEEACVVRKDIPDLWVTFLTNDKRRRKIDDERIAWAIEESKELEIRSAGARRRGCRPSSPSPPTPSDPRSSPTLADDAVPKSELKTPMRAEKGECWTKLSLA
ncbi:uncharacterized protein LOC112269958 [Brachypodium distachyon]|uniref:uncharacterized protein LOC112269958 n=1 Tax=Brachypodium distachyon TaxID=15368 RepID=UPI000D0CEDFB|nr:uncharacterized protein LOC112269958 [Brachypodium distachyon]|eukprot:XP_024313297.1 uncharacterized protein LOC112269958 [Brachypodium distachyon]